MLQNTEKNKITKTLNFSQIYKTAQRTHMVIMRENEFYGIFKISHFCSCFVEDP